MMTGAHARHAFIYSWSAPFIPVSPEKSMGVSARDASILAIQTCAAGIGGGRFFSGSEVNRWFKALQVLRP
jgi:hypothetical protein